MVLSLLIGAIFCGLAVAGTSPRWISHGPAATGGHVSRIVADPCTPGRYFGGIDGGGLFRSDDRGMSWRPLTAGLSPLGADPGCRFLWAEREGGSCYGRVDAIFRSSDSGDSWKSRGPAGSSGGEGPENGSWGCIDPAFHPDNPDELWAAHFETYNHGGTQSGVVKTSDGGASWIDTGLEAASPFNGFPEIVSMLRSDGGSATTFYAGAWDRFSPDAQIWRTTDGASTWDPLPHPKLLRLFDLQVAHSVSSTIFVVAGRPAPTVSNILRSTDSGLTWSDPSVDAIAVDRLSLDPNDPRILYSTSPFFGLSKSVDGAVHWRPLPAPASDPGPLVFDGHDGNRLLLGTAKDGFFWSEDGGESWEPSTGEFHYEPIVSLAAGGTNPPYLIASGANHMWRSGDAGKTWTEVAQTSGRFADVAASERSNFAFGASDQEGILVSSDAGISWGFRNPSGKGCYTRVAASSDGSYVYVAACAGQILYRSLDFGEVWVDVSWGLPGSSVTSLAVDGSNPLVAFVILDRSALFGTADAGVTWKKVDVPPGTSWGLVIDRVVVDPVRTAIYLEEPDGIYRSLDGARTWTFWPVSVELLWLDDLTVDECGTLFSASQSSGVLRSDDTGETWRLTGAGLDGDFVTGVRAHAGSVFCGTSRHGVYELDRGTGPLDR